MTSDARTARARNRSGLTGAARRLIGIGAGLLAAAVNTGNNLLYLLLGLLVASLVVSRIYSRLQLSGIVAGLRIPSGLRRETPFLFEVRLTNGNRRLAARGLSVSVVAEDGQPGSVWVERIDAGETVTLQVPARAGVRGVHAVSGIRILSAFPLGLLVTRRFVPRPAELLVLPSASGPVEPPQLHPGREGQALPSLRVVGNEYEGLRQGGADEDVRRIDWKSTARRGALIVRETSGESEARAELDIRTPARTPAAGEASTFERGIEHVSARAEQVIRAGGSVTLSVDGADAADYSGMRGLRSLLARLARLEPRPNPSDPGPTAERSAGPAVGPDRIVQTASRLALAIAVLALFAYGGLGAPMTAAILGTLAVTHLRPGLRTRRSGVSRGLWNFAACLALVRFVAELFLRNALFASLHLVGFITLFKVANGDTRRDDRQVLLVSLLHLVLSAALTTDVSFVIPLTLWVLVASYATMAEATLPAPGVSRVDRGRPRILLPATLSAAAILAGGVLFFALVPHLGTGTFAPNSLRPASVSGFGGSATLGEIGRIKLDRTPVFEARVRSGGADPAALRWRGLVLDRFDGTTWTRRQTIEDTLFADAGGTFDLTTGQGEIVDRGRSPLVDLEVRLEPGSQRVLFTAERPVSLSTADFSVVTRDHDQGLALPRPPQRRAAYRMRAVPIERDPSVLAAAGGRDPQSVRQRALQLPQLDSRIPVLARDLTADAGTRYEAAASIEQWLATSLDYSLEIADRGVDDPLASFLFDGMAGHCEYFASSMVMLARSAGIPSRLATGYLAGEPRRFGRGYLVRQSDAHAWVEVYFPGHGWVPFDPTPPSGLTVAGTPGWRGLLSELHAGITRLWDDHVMGLDVQDQWRAVLRVGDLLGAFGVAFLGGIADPGSVGFRMVIGVLLASVVAWRVLRRVGFRGLRGAWFRRSGDVVPDYYRELLRRLGSLGFRRGPRETAGEFSDRVGRELSDDSARAVRRLTRLYEDARFGKPARRDDERALARRLLTELQG